MSLLPLLEVCRRRGVPLIEDCAQAWVGPHDAGHPGALASLFSFGTIKTATALGGALTCVRDERVLARMRAAQAAWPGLPASSYRKKLVRAAALVGLSGPRAFGAAQTLLGARFERVIESAVRGFPGTDAQMLTSIRHRPPAALLRLLDHRLATWGSARLDARAANGERLRTVVGERMPGSQQPLRTHWLAPVVVNEPRALMKTLRSAGFDAGQGTTSLTSLSGTSSWLASVVYLPCYPGLDVDLLCSVLQRNRPSTIESSRCVSGSSPREYQVG
ncbi:MAG: DegT/DnrJ/EryC1/StrS family aminotransferase [Myxococcaceae bacterium]|nr:DegT/DnrJ/EryC1/StrS family aminotransferase [Myxococcaceae bacterium]